MGIGHGVRPVTPRARTKMAEAKRCDKCGAIFVTKRIGCYCDPCTEVELIKLLDFLEELEKNPHKTNTNLPYPVEPKDQSKPKDPRPNWAIWYEQQLNGMVNAVCATVKSFFSTITGIKREIINFIY